MKIDNYVLQAISRKEKETNKTGTNRPRREKG